MRVKIEGLPKLRAALQKLPSSATTAAQRAVKRSALNIESGAKQRCAVDTGRLRNSITHEVSDDGLSAEIGTNVEYAPHLEFGTRRMRARPFLGPAAEAEREPFVANLRKEFGNAVRRTD